MDKYILLNIKNIEKYRNYKPIYKEHIILLFEKFPFFKNYITSYYITNLNSFCICLSFKNMSMIINLFENNFSYSYYIRNIDFKTNTTYCKYEDINLILNNYAIQKYLKIELRKAKIEKIL